MAALNVTVTTPDGLVYRGEAEFLVVPALDGELGILPRHAPLIGMLGVGELRLRQPGGKELRFFVAGGFVQVLKNQVVVLATRAEAAVAIDRAKAEEEVRKLQSDALPPRSTIEARDARSERLRAAKARLRVATHAGKH